MCSVEEEDGDCKDNNGMRNRLMFVNGCVQYAAPYMPPPP